MESLRLLCGLRVPPRLAVWRQCRYDHTCLPLPPHRSSRSLPQGYPGNVTHDVDLSSHPRKRRRPTGPSVLHLFRDGREPVWESCAQRRFGLAGKLRDFLECHGVAVQDFHGRQLGGRYVRMRFRRGV
eukprot:Rmarinus@m.19412